MDSERHGHVTSVRRAMVIAEAIRENEGARVSELADHLDMPKSTVHGYLRTLHDEGYLIKKSDEYDIGMKFLRFGEYAQHRTKVFELAQETVEKLADQTDERAQFVIEEMGEGVFVCRESGERGVETGSGTGKRMYLHSTSAGKAILADLPERRVREIIDEHGLPAETGQTITDEDELFTELAEIRERGYAFNKEENIDGLNAIGTSVMDDTGRVIGALSISGPTNRMKGDYMNEELSDLLLGSANELELNVAYA